MVATAQMGSYYLLTLLGLIFLPYFSPEDEDDVIIEEDAHMDAVTGKVDVGWEGIKMVLKQKKKGDNKAERIILDGSLKGIANDGVCRLGQTELIH